MSKPFTAVLTVALLTAAGCSGGGPSGPTAPVAGGINVHTAYGTILVDTGGNDFDAAKAVDAIERGYAQARAQIGGTADTIGLNGVEVMVRTNLSQPAYGVYDPNRDEIEIKTGVEQVLRHELQHRFCYQMKLPQECCYLQDHPNGYDLHCNRL